MVGRVNLPCLIQLGQYFVQNVFIVKLQNDAYDSAFLQLIGRLLNVFEAECSNAPITFDLQLMVFFFII